MFFVTYIAGRPRSTYSIRPLKTFKRENTDSHLAYRIDLFWLAAYFYPDQAGVANLDTEDFGDKLK